MTEHNSRDIYNGAKRRPEDYDDSLLVEAEHAARDPRYGYTADEMNAMVRGETTPAELCDIAAQVCHVCGSERGWYGSCERCGADK